MMNKLKIGLLIAVLAVFGVASYANAAALTWTANYTVDLSAPDVNLTILSGSVATSLVVGTGTIQVVVPVGNSFSVMSSDRELNATGDVTSDITQTCSSGLSTLKVDGGPIVETITITPSAVQCNSGGGGSSGGSHRDTTPATPAVPANEAPPADCLLGYLFSPSTGRNCNAATPAVPTVCPQGNMFSAMTGQRCTSFTPPGLAIAQAAGGNAYAFGQATVKMGTKGEACRAWQSFFNAKRNAGLALDGDCGPLTMAAAKAWQTASGLVVDGLLGPASRAKANTQ